MSDRIAVIGSNSFSGATFIAHCLREGLQVLGMSRSPELADAFLPYKWVKDRNNGGSFQFTQLDLNRDTGAIADAICRFRPAYVVNFAAQSMVAQSWQHPEHWYQTNVVGNVKLHDRLRHFEFLERYVHVSTPEVYGNCTGTVDEATPFNPSTPYAASRAACDLHLLTFLKQYQFPVVFTRAANVYGPGQQLYRIIPRTMLYISLGKTLDLQGGGQSVRSFVHMKDVSDATLRIAQRGTIGHVYHIATEAHVSIRALVEMICAMMGANFSDVVRIAEERAGKDAAYLLDSSKVRRDLGWVDQIALEQGLEETRRWLSDHLVDLQQQPFDYVHKE